MEHLRLSNLLLDRLRGRFFRNRRLGVLNGRWRVTIAPAEATEAIRCGPFEAGAVLSQVLEPQKQRFGTLSQGGRCGPAVEEEPHKPAALAAARAESA